MDYWIESHQKLRGHPKTKRLQRRLRLGEACAVGYLHFLWWWAMDHAADGDLGCYDAADLADAVGYDGDAEEFAAALVTAGFVDRDATGWRLHDWYDYAGKLIERRQSDAARKRAERDARRAADNVADEPDPAAVPRYAASNGRPPDVPVTACVTSTGTSTDTNTPDPRGDLKPAAAAREAAAAAASEPAASDDGVRLLCEQWRGATGRAPTRAVRRDIAAVLEGGTPVDDLAFAIGELNERIERPWPYVQSVLRRVRGPAAGDQLEMPVLVSTSPAEPPPVDVVDAWPRVLDGLQRSVNPLMYELLSTAQPVSTEDTDVCVAVASGARSQRGIDFLLRRALTEALDRDVGVRLVPLPEEVAS